ncbi:hypothetical protein A9Q84_15410 [Halobacteriovorax marinus]|uniref:Uncharacterized protein n=1 Tax=Halobacteriovorax marinus TaxID=97084 RepID=A0A1Y5F3R5_9BACT|nr:hypothetical protein A9Q84_15410 [Halobacteriovorax marinus]
MKIKTIALGLLLASTTLTQAATANIWATIPFIRGADLCAYKQAYSQTRMEYMREMTYMASDLMESGAKGSEALQMLKTFDALYDKNIRLATQNKYLDVTLENTLKGYLSQYYSQYPVTEKKINFRHINNIRSVINAISNGQRIGNLEADAYELLDYVAYGSYSLAPNCRGNIQVTLTLVGPDGFTQTFEGTGKPNVVMSQIASRLFEVFQRTQFPSTLDLGNYSIRLVGAPNGNVGTTHNPSLAARTCARRGARLPSEEELEVISEYGDWNGGVSIGRSVWAVRSGSSAMVYHPGLRNPSPVRHMSAVNTRKFRYYCVQ